MGELPCGMYVERGERVRLKEGEERKEANVLSRLGYLQRQLR